jgi:hypothetical protein
MEKMSSIPTRIGGFSLMSRRLTPGATTLTTQMWSYDLRTNQPLARK